MDSPSNSSFQRYSATGPALLEDAVSALLEDDAPVLLDETVALLEEAVSELLDVWTAMLLEDCASALLEDVAELSIALSLELERRFPLEAGMTKDELVSAGMTDADGDASSEHAARLAIIAAHPIAINL